MKRCTFFFIIALLFAIIFIPLTRVNASTNTNFTIQKVPAKNEISQDSSFFDLKLAPGQKQTIEMIIRNISNQEITVFNQIFTTFTNANGEIDYTQANNEEYDASLKIKMRDIANVRESQIETVIPAHSQKNVFVDIEVPENAEDGVILGSWHFQQPTNKENNQQQEGMSITSEYAYAVAIKLTVNKEIAEPNLNLLNITTGTNNYRKAFLAQIQNNMPALTTRVEIVGRITRRGSLETLYENTMDSVNFAPNSNFQFPVFLGQDQMRAGEYTFRAKATTNDPKNGFTGKSWEWNMDFTVLPEEALRANTEALNDPVPKKDWATYLREYWWILAICLAVLLVVIILILKRKKDKADKKQDEIDLLLQYIKENKS
jgi:preprotein translocase subunit SecG